MNRFLLDTNILSEPLRPNPAPSVLGKLERHEDEVATASLVWHELWFGCRRLPPSRKRARLEEYLVQLEATPMPILGYDKAAAEWHAVERARLASIGRTPSFADGQIAAIAKVNDLVLVTANRADFEAFADLRIEDRRA